jgi:hypothetical protein
VNLKRILAAIAVATMALGTLTLVASATTYPPVCVDANPNGWRATARDFNPAWYDAASNNDRTAFATYVAAANGGRTLGSSLRADESICVNPARIPQVTSTTTTAPATTVAPSTTAAATTTLPATTTTRPPATTTTVAPTTTVRPTTTTAAPTTTAPATTTTQPAGTCTAASGFPGSSDGRGGCFPGPGLVGIPVGTVLRAYTGPCTLSVPNTTLDAYDFVSCRSGLLIRANNITITRSKIYDSVHGMDANGYSYSVSDSLLDGAQTGANGGAAGRACVNCGFDGFYFTLTRVEIIHTNRGAFCEFHCTIQDSWVHADNLDTRPCPQAPYNTCPHASGFRLQQFGNLIHNTIECDFGLFAGDEFNKDLGCSAAISGYPDFRPIMNNTVTGNLIRANPIGSSFCTYGGNTQNKPFSTDPQNATNIIWTNNTYERGPNRTSPYSGPGVCGRYGSNTDFGIGRSGNQWAGNVWNTGETIAPG